MMASTSSINSSSSGSQAPNPPPRTHSRPNQPPPPPPLPSMPPVPPTRDSSINISRTATSNTNSTNSKNPSPNVPPANVKSGPVTNGARFLAQFESLFKPLEDLPPPEPFTNKPKSYPSQRAEQKQSTMVPNIT